MMWDMSLYQGLATSRWVLDATTSSGLTIDTTVPGWAIATTGISNLFPAINASRTLAVFLELKDVTASGRSGDVSLNLGSAGLVWGAEGMRVRSSAGTATARDVATGGVSGADWGMRLQDGVLQGHFGGVMVEVPAGEAASSALVPSLAAGSNTIRFRQMVLTVVWPVSGGTVTQALAQPTGGDATSGALQLAQTAQTTADAAQSTANTAKSTATTAQTEATAAKSAADALVPRVAALEPLAQDTGWRKLPTADGVVGSIAMRRVGAFVYMTMQGVASSTAGHITICAVPAGFQPKTISGLNWRNGTVSDDAGLSVRQTSYYVGNMRILNAETKAYGGSISWLTADAFPASTTYPGTPA